MASQDVLGTWSWVAAVAVVRRGWILDIERRQSQEDFLASLMWEDSRTLGLSNWKMKLP